MTFYSTPKKVLQYRPKYRVIIIFVAYLEQSDIKYSYVLSIKSILLVDHKTENVESCVLISMHSLKEKKSEISHST